MSVCVSGQSTPFVRKTALGLHATFYDFKGADSIRYFGQSIKAGLALSYQNNLSPQMDVQVTLGGTFIDFITRKDKNIGTGKERLLLETTAGLRYRLLPPRYPVFPFVYAGIGFSQYNDYYGMFLPAGLGMQANITPDIYLLLNAQYRTPVTNTQNDHYYYSLGLAGVIGKKKTSRAVNKLPLPVVAAIPKDTDEDGIVDSADACPLVPGFARYQGCPVPDRDKDGINDEQDKCPDTPGLVFYQGCPAPDRPREAIADSVRLRVEKAAAQLFFETNKYKVLPASFAALDEVVQIMQHDPLLQLTIEGHTDNAGTPASNKTLSENRARAVYDYLVQKGIAPARLKAAGYGQEKPLADNTTAEGRAKNRRVELHLALVQVK